MDNPEIFSNPRIKIAKDPRIRNQASLRDEAGGSTTEVVRNADTLRVELKLAVVEVEVRRERESGLATRFEFVAGEIHIEFLITDESLGMCQGDCAADDGTETEFVRDEDLPSATS